MMSMNKLCRKIILILIIILVFGGTVTFINSLKFIVQGVGLGIYSIFMVFRHLPTSIFDLVASGITKNWIIIGTIWLDTLLLNIATIIPSIIIFLITKLGFRLNTFISSIISLVVLILVLELFSSVLFWILLVIFFVIGITVIFLSKKQSNK